MKISARARYGLAAVITMAEEQTDDELVTVISLSEKLKISKIYLEQVFALLKRGDIVTSTKGAKGGYSLSRPADKITLYEVLLSIENSLFEETEETVKESDPQLENCMQENIFKILDNTIKDTLTNITIEDLVDNLSQYRGNYMYYL
ncbi:MAG: Rrf2 family transcriptional regulator [Tissierellia bacterium]|nr:Rrf2 family transcriptional regulator [Tissierellia bacterium]